MIYITYRDGVKNLDMLAKNNYKTNRLVFILLLCSLAMFGFGFALVPIYDVLCKGLGINGKTGGQESLAAVSAIDYSRTITVQFVATNNERLPWKFYPMQRSIEVHPGQNTRVAYFAQNQTQNNMVVQAIPSVTPSRAAKYLRKTECFCFTQQTLKGHESMEMPLIFHIDRDLPADINTVTLSYTLFDVTGKQQKQSVSKDKIGRIGA